jgi:hypothetical protein
LSVQEDLLSTNFRIRPVVHAFDSKGALEVDGLPREEATSRFREMKVEKS